MEKIVTRYRPLACSLYDNLEAFATKHDHCTIIFRGEGGEEQIEGVIADLFSNDGVEFLKLDTGKTVRLDYLVEVNGIPMNKSC